MQDGVSIIPLTPTIGRRGTIGGVSRILCRIMNISFAEVYSQRVVAEINSSVAQEGDDNGAQNSISAVDDARSPRARSRKHSSTRKFAPAAANHTDRVLIKAESCSVRFANRWQLIKCRKSRTLV